MPVKSPEDVDPAFSEALNSRDVAALLSLYEPDAVFVAPGGEVVEGPAAIGEALGGFLAMEPAIELRTQRILRTGDTALVYSSWTVNGYGPDGPIVMTGNSTVVIREQGDGTWRLVIDDPGWGAG